MSEMNQMSDGMSPEPKKNNNQTIIIAVVVVVLLCCCCITLIGGWQFGDQIVQSVGF